MCVLVILRKPGGQREFDMLIGTTGSHVSLLPEVGRNQFQRFLRNAGSYHTARNLPVVQVELTAFRS